MNYVINDSLLPNRRKLFMENPFRYGGIVRGPYFADRTEELAELTREMINLGRVFLISPRRFGKTCLLFNLMDKLGELGFVTAYLDLNP